MIDNTIDLNALEEKKKTFLSIVLRNIISNEADEKYRRLKKGNHAVALLLSDTSVQELLLKIGFEDVGSELWLPLDKINIELLRCEHLSLSARRVQPTVAGTAAPIMASSKTVSPTPTQTTSSSSVGRNLLHAAAAASDASTIEQILIESPQFVLQADENGWLPLHEAVRAGAVDVVTLLLTLDSAPFQLTAETKGGANAMWWAVKFRQHEIMSLLSFYGAEERGPPHAEEEEAERRQVPHTCPLCSRALRVFGGRVGFGSFLTRAPTSSVTIECITCRDEKSEDRDASGYFMCGQCYNDRSYNHQDSHAFALYTPTSREIDSVAWPKPRPPPPPPESNRRGPWG